MEHETTFTIDGFKKSFSVKGSADFRYGDDEVLSSEKTDLTFSQPWYDEGYTEIDLLDEGQFTTLVNGISQSIAKIVQQVCNVDVNGFTLENYHKFVKSNEDHLSVVSRTRHLFSEDFVFPVEDIIPVLEKILNLKLTDVNPDTNERQHIIVRINRPQSDDFNPPHKDIYEGVDSEVSYIPQMVNFWIPIAGVNDRSNLPLVPKSHLISESEVMRTFDGGTIQGNKYRVRMVKSWGGGTDLHRSTVKYGQVLIFSGHLIHGLAVNDNPDITRVALEFRLFKSL